MINNSSYTNYLKNRKKLFENDKLNSIFNNCFFNTLETAIKFNDNGVFILTGDIPAMWLRDSAMEVMQYLYDIDKPEIKELIKAVIRKQLSLICVDPYANAFKENENQIGEWDQYDITDIKNPLVWERKFELDSLCYPLFLICKYFERTKDLTIFNDLFFEAFDLIIDTCQKERKHSVNSTYFFYRKVPWRDNATDVGKDSNSLGEKGLVWSGFRPSDDACKYNYHIPDNMFLVSVLYKLSSIFKNDLKDTKRSDVCVTLTYELKDLIDAYGVVELDGIGKVYVSETDCLGHYLFDDDANIPSLLSIPYLEYPFVDKQIYQNTRKMILSSKNKYYYSGSVLKGIGSPHTPDDMVWPLSLIMQGLTSSSEIEINECFNMLIKSACDNNLMHESVNVNNPNIYTRSWFCWANSLFAQFVLEKVNKKQ